MFLGQSFMKLVERRHNPLMDSRAFWLAVADLSSGSVALALSAIHELLHPASPHKNPSKRRKPIFVSGWLIKMCSQFSAKHLKWWNQNIAMKMVIDSAPLDGSCETV